jgi:hypothetical protein
MGILGARSQEFSSGYECQIPPDFVVKFQLTDVIDIIFSPIKRPTRVHMASSDRQSRGALRATAEVQ